MTHLVLVFLAAAHAADVVHHPAPKEPLFVKASWYATLKKALPAPPAAGSELQKSDEAELFRYQGNRTTADCDAAKAEVLVTLSNFFAQPRGPLSAADTEKLTPFFNQVRNDGDYFIQKLKKDFPRPRPFVYLKAVEPCVPREVTMAYPSGHAVLAKLYALVLADLYPSEAAKLENRAQEIADHRVLAGVHHRTDVDAGRELARLIYAELGKSKKYQAALIEARAAITAAN
jgi:acid phosphatase (class A)